MHAVLSSIALATLAATASAQGAVHVVDQANGTGTDFTDLSDAVDAAASGDLLLVRSGVYFDEVVLDGKVLSVVADDGASVELQDFEVRNLVTPGATVLMQGLELRPDFTFDSNGNLAGRLVDNTRPVWLDRCLFGSVLVPLAFQVSGGLFVENTATAVLVRSAIEPPSALGPIPGLLVRLTSRAHVFATDVLGMEGFLVPAVDFQGLFMEFVGSTAVGGNGSSSLIFCTDGNDGLLVSGGASLAVLLDATLAGGAAGGPACDDGQGLVVESGGSVLTPAGRSHTLDVPSPKREGEAFDLSIDGDPGDLVWLRYSSVAGNGLGSPLWDGEVLLGPPVKGFFAGVVGVSGVLTLPVTTPTLAPAEEAHVLYLQAFVRDGGNGRFRVSSPAALVILDAAL